MKRAIALLLLSGAGCARSATAPPPARAPDPEQIGGQLVADLLMRAHGPLQRPALATSGGAGGARGARASGRPQGWQFRITDDPTPGAHSLPGGTVLVARGALLQLDSEAELAAVLAHEIAHGVMGHTQLAKTAVPEHGSEGPSRTAAIDADEERQADALAVRYVERSGYAPGAVGRALSALSRGVIHQCRARGARSDCDTARDEDDPHPSMPARLARVALLAGTAGGEVGRARYLEQIRGLAVGGAEATVQSGRFHSVGGLSFAIPPGFSPALSGNVLSAKALDAELSIVRLSGALLRDAARAALCSAPYVAREAGGHRALIGTLGGDDSARVALVGDRTSVHVVAVSGPSRDLVLDRVLESVRRIDSGAMPRLAIVGAPRRMRFADFVRERCPGTDPALARSLNGLDDGAVVEAGHPLKCATK